MVDLALYLGMFAVGYLVGASLRRAGKTVPGIGALLTCIVMLLVFTMGLRIGANEDVVGNLNLIGLYALLFTIAVLVFTGLALTLVRRALGLDRHGMVATRRKGASAHEAHEAHGPHGSHEPYEPHGPHGSHEPHLPSTGAAETTSSGESPSAKRFDRMTLRILASTICGLAVGLAILSFTSLEFEQVDAIAALVIRVALCILLIAIGIDLGIEGSVVRNIREAGLRILAIPLTVIVATLSASAVCSLLLPMSLHECLAIGAGFGWYSLAPGIIMDQGYLTAGAISFLHNILRELLSILAVPLVARHVGFIECSGLGGATSMDVGLPVVEQSTNGITAVYAFVSGAVLSSLVPILVPIFITL